jgi:hypothetical protein
LEPKFKSADDMVRSMWRELGFYIVFDEEKNEIRVEADSAGLLSFAKLFRDYGTDPDTIEVGHEHLGPYSDPTIITGTEKKCTEKYIQGTQSDFLALALEVETEAGRMSPGESYFSQHFCNSSGIRIRFHLQKAGFDPCTADPLLQDEAKT